jgi:hypothetical protein
MYLGTDMEATKPKITIVGLPDAPEYDDRKGKHLRSGTVHPCEQCKCCSCMKICTMCRRNCSPSESFFVPVIGCPDFVHIKETPPVRYTYRTGYDFEYRLCLPGSR